MAEFRLLRDGLVALLAGRPEVGEVAAVSSVDEALERLPRGASVVVLLDMGVDGGTAAVRRLVRARRGCPVVAIGLPELAMSVVACAEAGMAGYVSRDATADDVVDAVTAVRRGDLLCSPSVAAGLLRRVAALAAERADEAPPVQLTPRELEIADLVERGCSNKDIAARLCIEVTTVKNHVHHILAKFHVARRGEAAAQVRRLRRTVV